MLITEASLSKNLLDDFKFVLKIHDRFYLASSASCQQCDRSHKPRGNKRFLVQNVGSQTSGFPSNFIHHQVRGQVVLIQGDLRVSSHFCKQCSLNFATCRNIWQCQDLEFRGQPTLTVSGLICCNYLLCISITQKVFISTESKNHTSVY